MHLLRDGQRAYMVESFQPNGCMRGGKMIVNNALYHSHRHVVEDNAAELRSRFKSVLIREPVMRPSDLSRLHLHTLFAVPKAGALARIVTHMSFGAPSYNSSVDMERHQKAYPRPTLPMLPDFADMLSRMRRKHPHCGYLHAAVVDARTAFQLYPLSFEKFLLVWTRLQIRRGARWVHLLQGNLCGTFGDAGAGDTWDLIASALQEIHNMVSDLWESLTYVDDMTIVAAPVLSDRVPTNRHYFTTARYGSFLSVPVDPPFRSGVQYAILDAIIEARENLACLFGPDSSEDRKSKLFCGCLEAVGWYFDLRYTHWYVVPLKGKIEKIAHYLFNVIAPGQTEAPLLDMQVLAGLLCWYSVAMPIGRSFVYTLFQCRRSTSGRVHIHAAALRDLEFWRALIRVALDDPACLGSPIELLRSDRLPEKFIVTDACTGIGGGAWLSSSPSWIPGSDNRWLVIRWTPAEREAIESRLKCYETISDEDWLPTVPSFDQYRIRGHSLVFPSLNINILEFATAVFAILVLAPLLRGCVVSLGADNTATLCWLVRNRSASGPADALLKLLSLTCVLYHIKLVVHHVKGIDNHLSDWMSRVLGADFADPHSIFITFQMTSDRSPFSQLLDDKGGQGRTLDRRSFCRLLLSHALLCTYSWPAAEIIRTLSLLRSYDAVPVMDDGRIPFVLDSFQRLFVEGSHPGVIPPTLDEAVAAARVWSSTDLASNDPIHNSA